LLSPADQVIRTSAIGSLVVGLPDPALLDAIQVFGRIDGNSAWTPIGAPIAAAKFRPTPAGVQIPLAWPRPWRESGAIVTDIKIVLAFASGVTSTRLDRIALHPAKGW
jgi:hypothetical protein